MPKLLIADDDEALCTLLSDYLSMDGYEIETVHRGDEVVPRLYRGDFDLLILDIMLPGQQGLDVLRSVRTSTLPTPVIMLTARGDDTDRIIGLELGADDYLPKPCNPRELSARIKAVLRRAPAGSKLPAREDKLRFGVFQLDRRQRRLSGPGGDIKLTVREFDLLRALLFQANQVVSKEQLSEQVLLRTLEPFDRSLDMHISHLRKKLGEHSRVDHIATVRGVGYCLYPEGAT
ncbi:MAG: DNA-binding response regulator [Spongiibacteraceae bacterium]|nr:DNA-binding response regulator [Spongiibacteraceae bacterium]|tara:strand:+ start:1098 stop:1796 length:699 start_codon:yes stop_codon:yes gene_type:complete